MLSVRFTLLTCVLFSVPSIGLTDETANAAPSANASRAKVQDYIDWFPSSSETLVVLEQPYQIPRQVVAPALDTSIHEFRLMRMFDQDARAVFVGTKINLWIEAATRFRLPDFPKDLKDIVNLTGCRNTYDGCHVLVFDDESPLNTAELFRHLLQQRPELDSLIPAPKRHQVEGHDTVEYVASHLASKRTRGGKETPLATKRIDAAWSDRYWITSPAKNVLIVSTSRDYLSQTLRKVKTPDKTAFPAALQEWNHISSDSRIWGMRHFRAKPEVTDMSDLRRRGDQAASGIAFEIDPNANRAKVTFLNCNQRAAESLRSSIEHYVYAKTQFKTEADGTLVAEIDWSMEPADIAGRIKLRLASWLQSHIGYAVVI